MWRRKSPMSKADKDCGEKVSNVVDGIICLAIQKTGGPSENCARNDDVARLEGGLPAMTISRGLRSNDDIARL